MTFPPLGGIILLESELNTMKKMYNVNAPKQKSNKIKIDKKDLHLRNELHFMACQNSNVAYVAKDKSKVIPRKQKYKERFTNYE